MQKILKKDPITGSFVKLDKNGEFKNLRLEDLQKHISSLGLNKKVPDEVRRIFEAAKDLYLFGYFRYYFFTIASHYVFLSLESALRNRYIELFGKPKTFIPLKTVIDGLVKKNIICNNDKYVYEISGELRNSLSHLTSPPVVTPGICLSTMEKTKENIEKLFN